MPNRKPGNHFNKIDRFKINEILVIENSISAVIIKANLIISHPVPAKKPPTTGYGIYLTNFPILRAPKIKKKNPTIIDVKVIVTKMNWNASLGLQLFPKVAITLVAIRAIIAIGIS